MGKLKVAIYGTGFHTWTGGADFLSMLTESLESTKKVETVLFVGKDSYFLEIARKTARLIKSGFRYRDCKKRWKEYDEMMNPLLDIFSKSCPKTEIIIYRRRFFCDERYLQKMLKKSKVDVLFPVNGIMSNNFRIPWIGYVYDFQHKKLPEYFDRKAIAARDKNFKNRVNNSRYVLVNAIDVKNDIDSYYPDHRAKVVCLPFKPFQVYENYEDINVEDYGISCKNYFVISNQFWKHKDHITAFKALEAIYNDGIKDLHIVCTGKVEDYRHPDYIEELLEYVKTLNCRDNIHILGYVDKCVQIKLIKNSIALIQPTLCEGGPGGGAVYNAVCLGVPCIVSDIPVNKEINGYSNVYFFERGSYIELASRMKAYKNYSKIPSEEVEKTIIRNRYEYGIGLIDVLVAAVNNWCSDATEN